MEGRRGLSPRMAKVSIMGDNFWKSLVKKENETRKIWSVEYKWMVDLYRDMEKNLQEMSKKSDFLKEVFIAEEEDPRSVSPIPESTNHQYGWIADKEEFGYKLTDLPKMKPLPPSYKLMIPKDHPHWKYTVP